MKDTDPFRASLDALTKFYVGDGSIDQTLQQIVDLAEAAVPAAEMTGLTMMVEDRPSTAYFSDADAPEIDRAQYTAGGGPCLQAFREKRVVRIRSTLDDDRWPIFNELALAYGIHSTLSLPMVAAQRAVGALNFYARGVDAFRGSDDEDKATMFADQAAIVLANSQAYWDARDLGEGLKEAMRSRAVIEQAKGIIMFQSRVDEETAFEMLRHASQRANRKLRDLAVELVELSRTRPERPQPS